MTALSHAPRDYACPFCLLVQGAANEHVFSRQTDIVYRDEQVTALISSHQWPNNHGHAIVIPNAHYENLYDLPLCLGARIHEVSRALALAMKETYHCEGTSTRQHNEPAGNQDVFHYHLHVFPRYTGDNLYGSNRVLMPSPIRASFAVRLRQALGDWQATVTSL